MSPIWKLHLSFQKDKLQSTYTGKGFEENGELFLQCNTAQATVDKDGNPRSTLKLSLMNTSYLKPDRFKDSRQVGLSRKNKQTVF